VHAGDDFFTFANGKYIENLKMPDDQSSWGSFAILHEESQNRVRGILEKDDGKMGKFYTSYMNKSLVDALDVTPIESMLAEVKAISNATQYAQISGRSSFSFFPSPFGVGIGPDAKDSNSYSVMVDQGGLGLPRDYYLKDMFAAKREHYMNYAAKLLEMAGWPHPKEASRQILALEKTIANVSWSDVELRDPVKTYNPVANIALLSEKAPGFDWATFLQEAGGLPGHSKMIVGALGGVVGIAKVLGKTDIGVLRSYTAFHLLSTVAPILSERFVNESFKFSKAMSGQKELSPRWKRATESLNGHMGEAVGQVFVQKFFPASAKLKVEGLTQELKKAFRKRLEKLDWMKSATKKKALAKLDSFSIMVGYPNKFRDYDGLDVSETDLVGNVKRSFVFDWNYELGHLGKPVDRNEWAMNPQTVNAYNMPQFNQVVFPAAMLQPPFFDPEADMAVNYGGIGAVIGHEMSHGFDDQGRHFNAKGQLEDWWTDADDKEFQRRAGAYDDQFVKFNLNVSKAHIKPNLTMGEDIADLGGLTFALDAFLATTGNKTLADNREGIRRVFLGWAQVWREKSLKDALLDQLASDPHPPSIARVNIPCHNIAAWYDAFDVKPGQHLYLPEDQRIVIW